MASKQTKEDSRDFKWNWTPQILEAGLLFVLPLIFYRGFAEQFSYTKVVLTEILVFLGLASWALGFVWGKVRWPAGFKMGAPLGLLAVAVLVFCFASRVPSFRLTEGPYFLFGPLWLFFLVLWRGGGARGRRAAPGAGAGGGGGPGEGGRPRGGGGEARAPRARRAGSARPGDGAGDRARLAARRGPGRATRSRTAPRRRDRGPHHGGPAIVLGPPGRPCRRPCTPGGPPRARRALLARALTHLRTNVPRPGTV